MTDRNRANTDYRATCAYWYAVGFADGSGDNDLAEEFRAAHRSEAEAYYSGSAFSLRSIPDAWRNFVAASKLSQVTK